MANRYQDLSKGQKVEVRQIVWKQIWKGLGILALIFTVSGGIGIWQIYSKLGKKVEVLVAKQFEEPQIKKVVSDVAAKKAEVLLLEQINPAVDRFMVEVTSKLKDMEVLVTSMQKSEAQVKSITQEVEGALSYVENSKKEVDSIKKSFLGLKSDFIKINRGIVELQYYTYKSRGMFGNNPYQKRIEQKINELLEIAVPNPQDRVKFVGELESYRPDKQ